APYRKAIRPMHDKSLFTTMATLASVAVAASPALAKGGTGGGGGTPKPVLPAPAIAPGTFDGIGPGPVYVHESFGSGQGTRLDQSGSVMDALKAESVNGIRAEYPNNRTETWFTTPADGPTWKLSG